MLESILSVASGGITGLLGSVFSNVFDYFKTKQKNSHELKLMEAEQKYLQMEIQGEVQVARQKRKGMEAEADADMLQASYKADKRRFLAEKWVDPDTTLGGVIAVLMAFVDFIRGMIRPVLVVGLTYVTTRLLSQAYAVMPDEGMSPTQAFEVINSITNTVLYITSTAVLWYFGTRPVRNGEKEKAK